MLIYYGGDKSRDKDLCFFCDFRGGDDHQRCRRTSLPEICSFSYSECFRFCYFYKPVPTIEEADLKEAE
jgi:hypothetical protein